MGGRDLLERDGGKGREGSGFRRMEGGEGFGDSLVLYDVSGLVYDE